VPQRSASPPDLCRYYWAKPLAPGGLTLYRVTLKHCRCWARLRGRFALRLGCLGGTLKASRIIAQGQRSGEAAKRHPGLRLETSVATLKGLRDARWNPFRVQRVAPIATQGSRCAATLGYGAEPLRGSPLWGWHRRPRNHDRKTSPCPTTATAAPPAAAGNGAASSRRGAGSPARQAGPTVGPFCRKGLELREDVGGGRSPARQAGPTKRKVIQKRIAGGGACVRFARKRRSRRTGDPETAPVWTPSVQFAPLEGTHGGNLRRSRVDRAPICIAAKGTGRQFASGRRRHLAACRRETGPLLSYSQNGRLDLTRCPQ
jgi:hypothetical protein